MIRTTFIFLLITTFSSAQPNTEVYLMDLNFGNEKFELSNFRNISNDPGYDSQPSFQSDNLVIFAGNNGGQTDIAQYNIRFGKKFWYHEGSASSQYSPQRIPGSENVLSVHLDSTGYQRLFHHHITLGDYKEAHPDLRVAYFAMYNKDILVGSVLGDDGLDLVVANLETKAVDTLAYDAGRSFHRVPDSESMSYTYVNEEGNHDVYLLDMSSFESFFVAELPIDVQDHVWLNDTTLLIGSGNKLFMYDLFGEDRWVEVADLSEFRIDNITRMAVSPDRTKLALVALPQSDPGDIVQRHIEPFNNRDLEVFADCFTDDVVVSNYPRQILYSGKSKLKFNYERFYLNNKNVRVAVQKRIVIGNTVIDEELADKSGDKYRQATIYTVRDDKIASMTFMGDTETNEDAEAVVQKQLDAYNNRDIDGFMATYSEEIELLEFPTRTMSSGQAVMRERYNSFFQQTPDLHCEIKNRIVIGNKVIDEEFITVNGNNFSAVAIYEVENGLISKVRFLR